MGSTTRALHGPQMAADLGEHAVPRCGCFMVSHRTSSAPSWRSAASLESVFTEIMPCAHSRTWHWTLHAVLTERAAGLHACAWERRREEAAYRDAASRRRQLEHLVPLASVLLHPQVAIWQHLWCACTHATLAEVHRLGRHAVCMSAACKW